MLEIWQLECALGCGHEAKISKPDKETGALSKKDIEEWNKSTSHWDKLFQINANF